MVLMVQCIINTVTQSDLDIEKPESKSLFPTPSPKSNRKGKEEFGLWAVSKIAKKTQVDSKRENTDESFVFKEHIIKEMF